MGISGRPELREKVGISGRPDLREKVAIVTGGARGIGAAIGMALAREGCAIVIADLLDTRETEAAARRQGARAVGVQTNMTDRQQVAALIQWAMDELGRIDILVNDAGTVGRVDLAHTDDSVWERDTDVIL